MRTPLKAAVFATLALNAVALADRPIADIVNELKTVKFSDDAAKRGETVTKLDTLTREAHGVLTGTPAADDKQLIRTGRSLFARIWSQMPPADATNQINGVIAAGKPEFLVSTARAGLAGITIRGLQDGTTPFADAQKTVEDLIAQDPKDASGSMLLYAVSQFAPDDTTREKLEARVVSLFPKSGEAVRIKDEQQQAKEIGNAVDLTFKDFRTGKEISLQRDLKGKVVVIDFWATWCAPCVASLPELKEKYAKYQSQGVEFISVSVDDSAAEGGEAQLKAFLNAQTGMNWPQYYQGNGMDSTFSKRWFVETVPVMFVVDADGKLRSNRGIGQLDKLIPELIAKRDAAKKPA